MTHFDPILLLLSACCRLLTLTTSKGQSGCGLQKSRDLQVGQSHLAAAKEQQARQQQGSQALLTCCAQLQQVQMRGVLLKIKHCREMLMLLDVNCLQLTAVVRAPRHAHTKAKAKGVVRQW